MCDSSRSRCQLDSFGQMALEGLTTRPVNANLSRIAKRSAIEHYALTIHGELELEAPMIVNDLLFGSTFLAGIHVKNQRIPTPFVRGRRRRGRKAVASRAPHRR